MCSLPQATGPIPSSPTPGSPCSPPLPSSTHQNPRNTKTVPDQEGFGTNTETGEASWPVLFSSVSAKDQTDGNLGQGESSLRKVSPEAWKLDLVPSTLPFFPYIPFSVAPQTIAAPAQLP